MKKDLSGFRLSYFRNQTNNKGGCEHATSVAEKDGEFFKVSCSRCGSYFYCHFISSDIFSDENGAVIMTLCITFTDRSELKFSRTVT